MSSIVVMSQGTKTETIKSVFWRCNKCGDELPSDTKKQLTYCSCRLIAVDGCEGYIRIIGKESDWTRVD